jgi:hypothetical protein
MIFATAANVIPLLVSAAPAAPKGLAHTAIIHPRLFWRTVRSLLEFILRVRRMDSCPMRDPLCRRCPRSLARPHAP